MNESLGHRTAADLQDAPGRSRIPCEQMGWPDGARGKVPAAVRTYAGWNPVGTLWTERTLERADDGPGTGRQILVTALTIRAKLKHVQVPP